MNKPKEEKKKEDPKFDGKKAHLSGTPKESRRDKAKKNQLPQNKEAEKTITGGRDSSKESRREKTKKNQLPQNKVPEKTNKGGRDSDSNKDTRQKPTQPKPGDAVSNKDTRPKPTHPKPGAE